jgi:hypothetical protein
MARPGENKVFGGTAVPAGKYIISRAFVGKGVLRLEGKEPQEYETLEVELLHLQNGQPSTEVVITTFKLNGCWRPRLDKDNNPKRHSGSFHDQLMKGFTGKSFAVTADGITQYFRGYEITISYEEYVSSTGVGHVWKADLGARHNLPELVVPAQAPAVPPVVPPAGNTVPF